MSDNDLFSMSSVFRTMNSAMASLVQATTSLPGNLVSEVDRFRMVREKTLAQLAGVSAEQAVWPPRAGGWSIAQIADHLLRTEQMHQGNFRNLIQMAREGRTSQQVGLRELDVSLFGVPRDVMRAFETPVGIFNRFVPHAFREMMVRYAVVPATHPTVADPRPGVTIEMLRAQMAASLVETEKLLRGPLPANVETPELIHPILGNNNVTRLMRIMIAHEERHQEQIAGFRAMPGFPKAAARA